jgi:mono/diheme cytochrome c family protein
MKKIAFGFIFLTVFLYSAWQGLNLFDDWFPFGRMRETPAIRPHEAVLPSMNPGSVPFSSPEELFMATPDNLLASPYQGNEKAVAARGEELYLTFCAQCHGVELDGNGTVGQSFSPLPADLRSRQVLALSDGILFKRISYGNPPQGRQPPLSTTIDAPDRWKIIAYIRNTGNREKLGQ